MKHKTTIFLTVLLLAVLFALPSCSKSNEQIKAIRDRGVLRVGVKVDVPRFGYLNPDSGEMEGIEIDLAGAIALDILGDENAVKFTGITAQTRGPLLDNGEIDIVIATFTITEERKQHFSFSQSYYTDELGYLVRAGSSITRPEDLNGVNAGVVQAGTAKDAFADECVKLGIEVAFSEYASYPEVKAALASGKVDVFIADKSILYGYLDDSSMLLDAGFNPQQYGIASRLGSDKLIERINALLVSMEKNNALDELYVKWGLAAG